MKSALKISLLILTCLSLSFCSLFQKDESNEEPEHDNYSSSGVYQDIEKASQDSPRNVSSDEDYSDDDYGDVENEEDSEDLILSDADNEEINEAPAPMDEPATEPLPVEKIAPVKKLPKKQKKKLASVSKFKDGMYRTKVDCSMRSKASASSKKVGVVNKGKKLWMEKHNRNWVKVYKKSGPVFINKLCL